MELKILSFRQKIFFSYLSLFIVLALLLIPTALYFTKKIHEGATKNQLRSLAATLQKSKNEQEMIATLQREKERLFMGITLYEVDKGVLFTYPEQVENQMSVEMALALKKGSDVEIRPSPFFGKEMLYVAYSFDFQGKEYVLRGAVPAENIHYREGIAAIALSLTALLIFALLASLIVQYFTRSMNHILGAIKSYRVAKEEFIPQISLAKVGNKHDEFVQLAETLNALSTKIENQISSLTQEKNNKAAILESLGEGVVAVDYAMTVTYINHMAEILLGVQKKELLGKNFILSKQEVCHRLIHEAQSRNESALAVLELERKPKRYIDAIAVPRGKEGAILVLQDKTSLHKVIELGKDFIANASHELKTPITIIRGFAETLHDHPEISHEVYSEITAKIVSNCERMEKLVRNLLTLAAVDEGLPRSRLHECDLIDVIEQARQTIVTVHPTASVDLEVRGEIPYLLLDGDLMLQAVINLMDNAVKYSKPPAHVTVILERVGNKVYIHVKDEGVGIPKEELDRIFERFYAVDKTYSRSLGGSGLGLSIVERIVEKHRGNIDVTSEVGKGSTFSLILPVTEEERY